MRYVICISLGANVVFAVLFWLLMRLLHKSTEEIKRLESVRERLIYQIGILRDLEEIKNANRKEAQSKMGSIDYSNVDTAISILHDNAKE